MPLIPALGRQRQADIHTYIHRETNRQTDRETERQRELKFQT